MGIFNEFVNLFFLWRARNSRDSSFSRGVSLSGGFGVRGGDSIFFWGWVSWGFFLFGGNILLGAALFCKLIFIIIKNNV